MENDRRLTFLASAGCPTHVPGTHQYMQCTNHTVLVVLLQSVAQPASRAVLARPEWTSL